MSDATGPLEDGQDATRRDIPSAPLDALDKTEIDPYATVHPAPADPDATARHSVFADPYATRMTEEATAGSAISSTQSWVETGSGGGGGTGSGRSRYRPVRLHARGGLGEIFVALDGELNREVALKEIQEQHGHRPDSQFRFIFEAEVTGGLEHPGIVPVYGLGRYLDGRPYYAMRFIRGDSLKVAIKRFHARAAARAEALRHSLEFRQLLGRFVAVCQAIDYAHGRGVLHRDIKPDNVMLGPHGETLVVDWGLAKAMDRPDIPENAGTGPGPLRPLSGSDGSMTMAGSVIGTPSYMSPEQASGEVETLGPASDIFSLGTTLYDLLTGHAPFRGKGLTELIEDVRRAQFPPPRAMNKAVPPALEAICLKAMALQPADRYPSAGALAVDLERWLGDEPVSAYPEPFAARAARWARRHRTAVTVGLALLTASAAGLGVSNVLIGRERARAERNFLMARSAVEQMLTRVGEVELADVPQMEQVRRDLLERARDFYLKFLAERGNDAWSRLETGRAFGRLGDIREMLGLYKQAEADYRRAIGLLERLPDDPEARRALARARAGLGILLKKSNRFVEAEALLRSAIAGRQALAAAHPDDPDDARGLSAARYQLGTLLAKLKGRGAEDEAAYRLAIKDQEAAVARLAGQPRARVELARSLNNLGILQSGDDPAAATDTLRRALKTLDPLEAESPTNVGFRWQRARARNNLAVLRLNGGVHDEAGTLFDQARAGFAGLKADFPTVPDYRRELDLLLNNLALMREARPAGAEAPADLLRVALDDQRALVAEFPEVPDHRQKLAVTCLNRGALSRTSDPAEAEKSFEEARSIAAGLVADYPQVPAYSTTLGRALGELALVRAGLGRGVDLPGLLDSAIEELERARRENPRDTSAAPYLVQIIDERARALMKLGRHADLAAEAHRLAEAVPDRVEVQLAAARYLARAFELAGPGQGASRDPYARDAVEALRRAYRRGLDGEATLDEPDFQPLRGRPDFEKLRGEAKGGTRRAVT